MNEPSATDEIDWDHWTRQLGDIPRERIISFPVPGTATERELVALTAEAETPLELVDGTLVGKTMGFYEGRLAIVLAGFLDAWARHSGLGIVVGPDATVRLKPGLARAPDVAFIRRDRLPQGRVPRDPVPALAPDLAVEIVSGGNTPRELNRKVSEYLDAGTRLVWVCYPNTAQVHVYHPDRTCFFVDAAGVLRDDEVLPGFTLSVREWLAAAE